MPTNLLRALDAEIHQLESRLSALRSARTALAPVAAGQGRSGHSRITRKRRNLTVAERKAISVRMKAAWAKRKANR